MCIRDRIGWVHDEIERTLAEVEAELEDLITLSLIHI